jgi:hypothetical protein
MAEEKGAHHKDTQDSERAGLPGFLMNTSSCLWDFVVRSEFFSSKRGVITSEGSLCVFTNRRLMSQSCISL